MKQMKKRILALLAVLALAAALLAGCGGKDNSRPSAPDPAPSGDESNTEKEPPVSDPAPPPEEDAQPEEAAPSGEEDAAGEESGANIEVPPDEPAPEPPAPEEQPVSAPAQPEPASESGPEPEPEPEPDTQLADGVYTISVTLEGGTGRATVESPATLRVENGQYWAIIVWSSSNFDYMKVDGQRYDQTNTEGNSTFEIPVAALDQVLPVIADTIAMSEPHEVEYTMTFDSSSIQKA